VLHFAARYCGELTGTLDRVWKVQGAGDAWDLSRKQLVKMDPYWWTLAKILVANRFQDKKYRFLSGIVVYEDDPNVFLEEEAKALELEVQVIEESKKAAETPKQVAGGDKMDRSLEDSIRSLARVNAKLKALKKNLARYERSKVAKANGRKLKETSIQPLEQVSATTNTPTSGPHTQTAGPSNLLSSHAPPALHPRSLTSEAQHSRTSSEQKEAAHAMVRLRVVRDLVGSHRIAAFEAFLAQALQADTLSKIGDGKIDLGTLGLRDKGNSVVRRKQSARTASDKRSRIEGDDEDFEGQPLKKARQS